MDIKVVKIDNKVFRTVKTHFLVITEEDGFGEESICSIVEDWLDEEMAGIYIKNTCKWSIVEDVELIKTVLKEKIVEMNDIIDSIVEEKIVKTDNDIKSLFHKKELYYSKLFSLV